jgi:hypothetical protein
MFLQIVSFADDARRTDATLDLFVRQRAAKLNRQPQKDSPDNNWRLRRGDCSIRQRF